MHPAFRLCWVALLVQPTIVASALLMGYAPAGRQRHGHGAGPTCRPMMIRGDTESFTDYYTRRNAGAAGAPAAVVDPAAEDPEVAQKVRGILAAAQQKYDIPAEYVRMLDGFFLCYMLEIQKSGHGMAYFEDVLCQLLGHVLSLSAAPHRFEPYHVAIREPFDYYMMGVEFIRGLVDQPRSVTRGLDNIATMEKQLAAGDNVILLANHQTEADPQIFSLLLDEAYPGFATSTIFVAGDRVTSDAIAMPFSMGRNLLCIFSKKHLNNPPEQRGEKQKHNRMVMKKMLGLFKEGGQCVWVAPSGGRDRPDENGDVQVAPFDAKSVEMFRLMSDKAGRTAHFYPLSMVTAAVCPPPVAVGGAVGEVRIVKHAPAGLHFADEMNLAEFEEGCLVPSFGEAPVFPLDCGGDRDALRDAFAAACHAKVDENYHALNEALALAEESEATTREEELTTR